MKKTIIKITVLNLFAAVMLAVSPNALAQDESGPNTSTAPAKPKKHDRLVFNGKLSAVDNSAMTLTIGKRTFEVTADTKITKDGKPATLAEGVVGEPVGGAYKKGADGKLTATTIRFGAKPDGGKKKKKTKSSEDDMGGGTNSVSN